MAVTRQTEHSVLSSLSELKAIERQRVADERAAVEAEVAARIAAREAEARAKEEAEAAKLRAEREAALAIETARLDAEREARMKIEAAEVSERTRQQAILAEQRLAQEMELRRAEVAKKRPTWMLAVTAIATIAAFVLVYVTIDRTRAQNAAETRTAVAIKTQNDIKAQFEELKVTIAKLEVDGAALEVRTQQLAKELAAADTQAKIAEANGKAAKLEADKRAFRQQQDEAQRLKDKIERGKGVHMNTTDTATPLGNMRTK